MEVTVEVVLDAGAAVDEAAGFAATVNDTFAVPIIFSL